MIIESIQSSTMDDGLLDLRDSYLPDGLNFELGELYCQRKFNGHLLSVRDAAADIFLHGKIYKNIFKI